MKPLYPHTHTSRYVDLYRTAQRKGFELVPGNNSRAWSLTERDTGQQFADGVTLDDVAAFLWTKPLP